MQSVENVLSEVCCACLTTNVHLTSTIDLDSNNVDFLTKLKFSIPEVKWTKGYICDFCLNALNQTYIFKELCIKTNQLLIQKKYQVLIKEEESYSNDRPVQVDDQSEDEDDNDACDNYDNDSNINSPSSNCMDEESQENNDDKKISEVPLTYPSEYSCEFCSRKYKERSSLFSHKKKIHKPDRPFNCVFCSKLFKHLGELKRHEKIHLNERSYMCDICNKSYNTGPVLATHKIIVHTDPEEWRYICQHCDKKFPIKSSLDQHVMRHHTNASNTYICYHCNEKFDSRVLIIAHIKSKHSKTSQQRSKECHVCNKMYINQVVLENHLRKEHNIGSTVLTKRPKQFPCEKCGKKYTTVYVLNIHSQACDGIKRHSKTKEQKEGATKSDCDNSHDDDENTEDSKQSNEESNAKNKEIKNETPEIEDKVLTQQQPKKQRQLYLTCEFCNQVIGTYKKLVAHAVEKHDADPKTIKPYICNECDARFTSSMNLAKHKTYHTGNRGHICSFCGKGFKTKKDMLTHEKLHSNKREVQCEICSKRFHTKSYLRSHKLVVHTDPIHWKYVCPHCPMRRFPMKSNYDAHIRRHTGEKPFACHLCEKRFSDKIVLQKHFQAHSNIRAHKCDSCGKAYKNRDALNIHLKKVHDIGNAKIPTVVKKFVCDFCLKTFASRDKLRRHMCSHTGERPFSCEICQKKFTDKSYVKQHLKSVHNIYQNNQDYV